MANDLTVGATQVAATADFVLASTARRPLPPVAMPAEVADAGLIRIGAGLGLPSKRA